MTQIWPGFGDAPVPTVLSMICKPDAVVMGFPAVWADAIVAIITGVDIAAAIAAKAVFMIVRREDRILDTFPWINRNVSSPTDLALPPRSTSKYAGLEAPARRLICA